MAIGQNSTRILASMVSSTLCGKVHDVSNSNIAMGTSYGPTQLMV